MVEKFFQEEEQKDATKSQSAVDKRLYRLISQREPEGITYETATSASSKAGESSFFHGEVANEETSSYRLVTRQPGNGNIIPIPDVGGVGSFEKQDETNAQRSIHTCGCAGRAEPAHCDSPTKDSGGSNSIGAITRSESVDYKNLLKKIVSFPFLALIWIYRNFISPLFPSSCIYTPTCSKYSFEAISKYGPFKGIWLSIKRIIRCRPGMPGGYDPVP